MKRQRSTGLTREKVFATALAIADDEGLDAVSFRRLAGRLGVTPMAIYHYVFDKDELLDGLGDLVLQEVALPAAGLDWQRELRAAAHSLRRALLAHPAVLPVFVTRPLYTPAALKTADTMIGLLQSAGFSVERATLLYRQLARSLFALIALDATTIAMDAASLVEEELARLRLEALPREEYPHLVDAAPHLAKTPDSALAFATGLDLLVAGTEGLLRA
jgi:AcrR family transcriptional regulator